MTADKPKSDNSVFLIGRCLCLGYFLRVIVDDVAAAS